MKKLLLKVNILFTTVLLFLFIISCNGQVKTNLPKKDTIVPKIVRTQGLVSGNVLCKLQDKFGNLWFCTSGEGVYKYDGKSFTNFTTKDGLSSNDVNAIIEDKAGNILFGTKSGICKYSFSLKNNEKPITKFSKNDDESQKPISSMLEDRKGNLWFGVWNGGIYCYTPTALLKAGEKNYTNFLNNDDYHFNLGNHHQLILDILEDKSGNLWFSSWNGGGVWKYNPSASLKAGEKPFKNFLPSAEYYKNNQDERTNSNQATYLSNFIYSQTNDTITDDMIFSMAEDKAGNIWFATRRHGVCRYEPTASLRAGAKSFTSFREPEGFISRAIYDILIDKKGIIWLTTDANGVFLYDGKSFKNFTTKDGLINNSVFSAFEDKDGFLWFGTRGFGLSRYNPSGGVGGKMFTNFSE